MNKRLLLISAVLAMISLNANASEIAILDVEKIVKESSAMRDIQSKVSKRQAEYQKDVDKKQKTLEVEQKRIEGKKSLLSKEALEKEVTEFDKKVEDLKQFVDSKQNTLKKASLEAMSKVNEKIKEIMSEIAKEKKIDVVIPANQAIHYDEKLDISSEVLEKLNKKLTKIEVKFE